MSKALFLQSSSLLCRRKVLSCGVSAMADPSAATKGDATQDGLSQLARSILPHILNLYNCKANAADFDVYASNATFEDPLMRANGVPQIKSAFYSIPKVFSEGRISDDYSVVEEPENGEIRIDNVQHYKFLGRQIDMPSLIKLKVENGKVISHQDLWHKQPLKSRDTVKLPLVGRLAESVRRGNMMITHLLMGCGKDPATAA
ncbi:uncharacterized protein LOC9658385 [Selaginella moellendorffii]|nr:uncharacterized protein LOC9658385 [Selaginella moellendorffii]|eukprot:XP_002974443.2 uncharacterized protein LOC9658385 [Selaginella moellendorffii]